MKKALQISIARTLFTIEDDAYATLEGYLSSVKRHFESSSERDEIVSDIESRIAEQLLESKEQVITLPTVERIIAQMGSVDDFDDGEEKNEARTEARKKLYRSVDDRLIAGVCAGLASYFGFEAIWVRLAFIVLTVLNGIGILVYGVLWLLIPEAKTASQKLEMKGSPVTLETLSETVSERVAELRSSRAPKLARIIAIPFRVLGTLIRVVVGLGLTFGAGAGIVGVMIASGFLLSGSTLIADEVPLSALLPGAEHWIFLMAATMAIVIPLIFVLLAGVALLTKRSVIIAQAALALLGIWFVSLLVSGFGAARVVTNYQNFVETAPAYQTTSLSIPLEGDFDSLIIERGASVNIVQGTTSVPTLVAEGRAKYVDSYAASIQDGALTITRKPRTQQGVCMFCGISHPTLTLTVPSLESMTIRNGGSARSSDFPASGEFALTLSDGATADLTLNVRNLIASLKGGAYLSVDGTAQDADLTLSDGAVLRGRDFAIENATITGTRGTYAEIQVSGTLDASAENGSTIRYSGEAEVTEKTKGGGMISEY